MQESLQRVLAWAKANPVLAGAVVVGGAVLVYFLVKGVGSGAGEPTPLTADDIGSGGGIGGDDIVPITPIPDFLLPDPGYIGGDGWSNTPSGPVSISGQSGIAGASGKAATKGWGSGDIVQTLSTPASGSWAMQVRDIVTGSQQLPRFGRAGGMVTVPTTTRVISTPGVVEYGGLKRSGPGAITPATTTMKTTHVVVTPTTVAIEGFKRAR